MNDGTRNHCKCTQPYWFPVICSPWRFGESKKKTKANTWLGIGDGRIYPLFPTCLAARPFNSWRDSVAMFKVPTWIISIGRSELSLYLNHPSHDPTLWRRPRWRLHFLSLPFAYIRTQSTFSERLFVRVFVCPLPDVCFFRYSHFSWWKGQTDEVVRDLSWIMVPRYSFFSLHGNVRMFE